MVTLAAADSTFLRAWGSYEYAPSGSAASATATPATPPPATTDGDVPAATPDADVPAPAVYGHASAGGCIFFKWKLFADDDDWSCWREWPK